MKILLKYDILRLLRDIGIILFIQVLANIVKILKRKLEFCFTAYILQS